MRKRIFLLLTSILVLNYGYSQIKLIKDLNAELNGYSDPSIVFNDNLFFQNSTTTELYTTINQHEDLVLLPDSTLSPIKRPNDYIVYNDKLFLTGFVSGQGYTFYQSDGTASGTYKILSNYFSFIFSVTSEGSKLFFTGEVDNNYNFYVLDLDTYELTKIVDSVGYDFKRPGNYTKYGDEIYFLDFENSISTKLWKYDPNLNEVEKINNGWKDASIITSFQDKLVLRTTTTAFGSELFIGDGTPSGTQLLKNVNEGNGDSNPSLLYQTDSLLYFSMDDGINGRELWVSNGTSSGTYLFQDFNSGPDGSHPEKMFSLGVDLYIILRSAESGRELHKINNNEITLVKNINGISTTSGLSNIVQNKDVIYFNADDGIHGEELWVSDGSFEGTMMVEDYTMGNTPKPFSTVSPVAITDKGLYLTMDLENLGRELYFLPLETSSNDFVSLNTDEITVYPNPTEGNVTISSNSLVKTYQIIENSGKIILSTKNIQDVESNIKALKAGLFYIVTYNQKGQLIGNTKIIKI